MDLQQGLAPGMLHASTLLPFDPTDPPRTFRAVVIEEDVEFGPKAGADEGIRPRATLVEIVPRPRAVASSRLIDAVDALLARAVTFDTPNRRRTHPSSRGRRPRAAFRVDPLWADPGQHLVIYSPEPDTASYDSIQILASRATQPRPQREPAHAPADDEAPAKDGR